MKFRVEKYNNDDILIFNEDDFRQSVPDFIVYLPYGYRLIWKSAKSKSPKVVGKYYPILSDFNDMITEPIPNYTVEFSSNKEAREWAEIADGLRAF